MQISLFSLIFSWFSFISFFRKNNDKYDFNFKTRKMSSQTPVLSYQNAN